MTTSPLPTRTDARPVRPDGTPAGGHDADSLGALVSAATSDLSALVRMEVELAKAEITVEVKKAGIGAAAFGAAAFIALLGVILLSGAIAEAIALGLPRWLSYLIVALVYFLLAGVAAFIGLRFIKKISAPARTIETVKDDLAWARHPTTVPGSRPVPAGGSAPSLTKG